jgi:hypothetical protein
MISLRYLSGSRPPGWVAAIVAECNTSSAGRKPRLRVQLQVE